MDMPKKSVMQLVRGDQLDHTLLVDNANYKQTKDRKPFLQLILRDHSGRIQAIKWHATDALFQTIKVGDAVEVKGRVQEYQGKRQVLIDNIRKADNRDIAWHTFLPASNVQPEKLWKELESIVAAMADPHLKALLTSFLADADLAGRLKSWPAGKTLHHAYLGGLLEHVMSIIKNAHSLHAHWPDLNRDLLTAGAVLHDIGKLRELSCESTVQYTDQGQLIGHTQIGIQMLREKIAAMPDFPEELAMELEHIIVSHHGKAEYGAAKPPLTGEAMAIHFLDNMDARLSAYFAIINQEEESPYGDHWTSFHRLFDNRLFKPARLRRET